MWPLTPRALAAVVAASPSKIQLLNWDRTLVQDVHLLSLALFVSALLLPFLMPLLLNLPWVPHWIEALYARRLRRCVVSCLALLGVATILGAAGTYWPEALLGVPQDYFTAATTVQQQYEGLFGLRPGVPVAAQGTLALAALASAPILGIAIAGMTYKVYEWTLSLKARAEHLAR